MITPAMLGVVARRGGSAGGDPYFANVALLLHCEGANGSTTLTDSSASPVTFTARGNAQISTAQMIAGSASALFDGSGDWFDCTTPTKLKLGIGDFTIEGWVRLAATGSFRTLLQLNESSGQAALGIRINNSNVLEYIKIGSSGNTFGTAALSANTWYHWAVARASGTIRGFLDGALGSSSYSDSTDLVKSTTELSYISGPSFIMNGHLDEIRVTVGVARYTAAFTAPTPPFPDS